MPGMTAGLNFLDPVLEYKRRLAEGDRNRKLTEANTLNTSRNMMQDEAARNALSAQRTALDQSNMMQSNADNPRTATDTSFSISSPGQGGASASGSRSAASPRRLPSGGFGGTGLPQIDGRYMALVAPPKPELNESLPPQVQMPPPAFGMPDAKAHQDAAFSRLKDKQGQIGQSALQSLASTLAGRGISGKSGTFGRGLADILARTLQPQSDLNVAHLGEEYDAAGRERQLSEQRASQQYQGGISQRSTDISSQQALNNLRTQLAIAGYQGEMGQNANELELLYRLL